MRDLFGQQATPVDSGKRADEAKERPDDLNSGQPTRVAITRAPNFARRVRSAMLLEDVLPWHYEKGAAYHVVTYGDVDVMTFLKTALKQQPLEYVLMSTFAMAWTDVAVIRDWIEKGLIKRLDVYLGEIFSHKFSDVYLALKEIIRPGAGRIAIFRNHSKVFVGFGERFDFVVETSANINTNPRFEQTCITVDTDLARWYKSEVFDHIYAFNKDDDFTDWKPYKLKRDEII